MDAYVPQRAQVCGLNDTNPGEILLSLYHIIGAMDAKNAPMIHIASARPHRRSDVRQVEAQVDPKTVQVV